MTTRAIPVGFTLVALLFFHQGTRRNHRFAATADYDTGRDLNKLTRWLSGSGEEVRTTRRARPRPVSLFLLWC